MKEAKSGVFDAVRRRGPVFSRRDAVRSLGFMCASGPLLFADHLRIPARQESRRIDVHHHFFHPGAKQRFERFGPAPRIQAYSPEASLAAMDAAGIERAIVSLPTRLADEASAIGQEEIAFAREANEYAARMMSDHPGRFEFFAFLPLPDIDASLREIEYALDQLGASGVGLITSYGNRWLGHPDFRPVLEELDRRGALAYTHPYDAPCCRGLQPNTIPQTVEWNTDTSRAIWSLINDGEERPGVTVPTPSMATVHSNVRFIWSHAGGSLLGLVGRFLGGDISPIVDLPSSPAAELQALPPPKVLLRHCGIYEPDPDACARLSGGGESDSPRYGLAVPFGGGSRRRVGRSRPSNRMTSFRSNAVTR